MTNLSNTVMVFDNKCWMLYVQADDIGSDNVLDNQMVLNKVTTAVAPGSSDQ